MAAGARQALTACFWLSASVVSAHSDHAHTTTTNTPQVSGSQLTSELARYAPLVVTRITADNAASLIRQGPDAIGGIGDWFVSNGTLCAIISDVHHESEFSTRGGSLVDLGFCDREDEYFASFHDLLNGSRRLPMDAQRIETQLTDASAVVIVHSTQGTAKMQTRYTLSTQAPTELHIQKQLHNAPDLKFYSSLNFNLHSLEPFVFNSQYPARSNGFQNEDFVERGQSAIPEAARDADMIITPSPPDAVQSISYGWRMVKAERVDGEDRYSVPFFMLADDSSNAMLVLSDTFYIGDGSQIGWLQLPQLLLLDLGEDILETEEIVYVGRHGDVASITDQLFSDAATLSGEVSEPDVAIHVRDARGNPITHVRPQANGEFSLRLPTGQYLLDVVASAGRRLQKTVNVAQGDQFIPMLVLPPAPRLRLPQGHPMRLVFKGLNGTPDPNFTDTYTGFSVRNGDQNHTATPVSQVFLAGVDSDPNYIELAPGDYRVYAVHGLEHSLESVNISVRAESTTDLIVPIPKRQLKTPGYIAADLHVHSGASYDNAFAETERVRTFVAENGEVMVSSEHDIPVDFQPKIEALGVANRITAIAAAEITSLLPTALNPYTGGHANFFPYTPDPLAYRRGMINHENRRWREIIHDVKQREPEVVVQLNHPRLDMRLSGDTLPSNWSEIVDHGQFLDHMGSAGHPYNPHQPLHSSPNNLLIETDKNTGLSDLSFDLIEVINPGGEHYQERIQAIRQDWLSFVKQGYRLVGTANSDSHGSDVQVAVPRTMVKISDDRVPHFNQSEFLKSLKRGDAYGTTGPMLEVKLNGVSMGGTVQAERAQLDVTIQSVDWIPLNQVRLQVNGVTIEEYDLTPGKTEHKLLIPMEFDQDAFVTLEASGEPTPAYLDVYPGLTPYAFSNPIYVDVNADGVWTPPGL
ncbi:hypothetical protein GCM10008090_21330 [Arenicella chitinivorans]|uniref:Carboxypeptidase regulatory-like domain-containing protein n=1 Tax=Arenicella chitinivorans TaxID=1329800 RepID=A0A918RUW2_9GAMM|nr:CehA/McbA family metallohydrolase [Arenicella chitinivorans]GHA11302.1 hypothetical protein GCM10008090_21330 [Arenicella chitinivorans]